MPTFLVVLGLIFVLWGIYLGRREPERPPQVDVDLHELDGLLRTGLSTISEALAVLLGSRERPEAPVLVAPVAAAIEPATPDPTAANHEVYALADEGLDTGEIARRLHRHRGEIDLILRLRGLGR